MQWTNFVRNLLTPGNEAKVLPDFGEVIEKMSEQGKREAGLKKVLKGIGIMVLVLIAINYIRDSGVMDQVMEKHLAVDDSMSIKNTIGRLSNEELAWHAVNTYQWDCDEVVSRGKMSNAEFYPITCSNGKMLRVYPRQNTHPKITNKSGSSR